MREVIRPRRFTDERLATLRSVDMCVSAWMARGVRPTMSQVWAECGSGCRGEFDELVIQGLWSGLVDWVIRPDEASTLCVGLPGIELCISDPRLIHWAQDLADSVGSSCWLAGSSCPQSAYDASWRSTPTPTTLACVGAGVGDLHLRRILSARLASSRANSPARMPAAMARAADEVKRSVRSRMWPEPDPFDASELGEIKTKVAEFLTAGAPQRDRLA